MLDGGALFLASVSPTDGGDYECQATNEAGSASRRVKLVVYGEQGPPELGQLVPQDAQGPRAPRGSLQATLCLGWGWGA